MSAAQRRVDLLVLTSLSWMGFVLSIITILVGGTAFTPAVILVLVIIGVVAIAATIGWLRAR